MRTKLAIALLASAVAACSTPGMNPAARGVESINQPVLARETFTFDAAAPAGILAPEEMGRLDGWFRSLGLGYGDSIFIDGDATPEVRDQVAEIAGHYGLMVLPAAPVTAGMVPPGNVRIVVARTRAEVPGCPNWSVPAQPNSDNAMMSNFGCAINSNYAAMVANPEDLFHGREPGAAADTETAAKAVEYYRNSPPTGTQGLQNINTKQGK